ncbi:nascent polypeptide-associated complex subunit alpha [Drosophila santomea]|uniref:nascent polypeptide-associated complex subunit alpha n=1 Tax=Drosophila santomea TaxID=129105 RepID=UPI0019535048|nr:nascent polypeptide-associated complex subunit alpha [Drosophila santomea]
MGKKQKMKKAQMATAAAKLEKEVATKEKSIEDATPAACCSGKKKKETQRKDAAKGVQMELAQLEDAVDAQKKAPPGFSGAKGKPHIMGHMDPAYRNKIKKLMSLAQHLPPNVFDLQSQQKEKRTSAEDSSADEDDRSTDSDDAPDLVEADLKAAEPEDLGQLGSLAVRPGDGPKHSRGEKKARRILMKLDLKPVENVVRVTMKKSKNLLLYINQPDVFRVAHSQTYIFFGEIGVEDISSSAAAKAAERFRDPSPTGGQDDKADVKAPGGPSVADEEDEDDGDDVDVDDQGLDVKDIELVQMQAACSRKKAIQALLKNDNDVVNAIMALTVG